MALSRLVKRTYYRSSRSENPHVKLNISLTHCNNIQDLILLIKDEELLLPQKTFALRMIGRIISSRPFEISHLNNPIYDKIVKDVYDKIDELKPIDLCDVLFWLRSTRILGKNPFKFSETSHIISLIENLCKNQALTIRQTVSFIYDTSYFGKSNASCFEDISKKLEDDNEFISFDDIRQLFVCGKHSPDSLSPSVLNSAINRIYRKYDDTWKISNFTSILSHYSEICSKAYIDVDKNFIDFCTEKIVKKSYKLGEIQNHEVLWAHSAYNVLPGDFIENMIKDYRKKARQLIRLIGS